jgi:threonine dehydratase
MQKIIDLVHATRVYEVASESPLSVAHQLSVRSKNTIYLKREDKQVVHSFKLRGAYQKISGLSAKQKAKGVVASSAGNHAQGVALSASKLGIESVIVMPLSTPKIKVNAVEQLGGIQGWRVFWLNTDNLNVWRIMFDISRYTCNQSTTTHGDKSPVHLWILF